MYIHVAPQDKYTLKYFVRKILCKGLFVFILTLNGATLNLPPPPKITILTAKPDLFQPLRLIATLKPWQTTSPT